jgi:hypothetical protein
MCLLIEYIGNHDAMAYALCAVFAATTQGPDLPGRAPDLAGMQSNPPSKSHMHAILA